MSDGPNRITRATRRILPSRGETLPWLRRHVGPRRPRHSTSYPLGTCRDRTCRGLTPAMSAMIIDVRPTAFLPFSHGQGSIAYRPPGARHRPPPRRSLAGGGGHHRVEPGGRRRLHAGGVREGVLRRADGGVAGLALRRPRLPRAAPPRPRAPELLAATAPDPLPLATDCHVGGGLDFGRESPCAQPRAACDRAVGR